MRYLIALAVAAMLSAPARAETDTDKRQDCQYQADVAAAVQRARLDGVREARVAETIAAGNPAWPERYSRAIPILAGEIYKLKKRDLRKVDLGRQWMTACMAE